ncbi:MULTISPECIES: DUF2207 domain-containing protein [unclassified Chryseobacterium]|uniref:DUF2207 domain-containing protein n=1 Tax=unclassified Chryseobacterium TaxID=2593645 RepID=UPI002269AFA6|nr:MULTISPECIES: DUF2207 domain-containing protein [unclassified Chryseobacterium]
MKKFLLLFYLLFFAFTFAQQHIEDDLNSSEAVSVDYEKERITSFHSDIDVNKNSGLTITEKINVYSTGNEIKRGIFRTLPLSRNLNNKKQKVTYDIISITKNGETENYHTETNGDNLEIYVGNKDVILEVGNYAYEIKYETKNQIGFFNNYDELYWNVNGNAWNFDVDTISAKVNLPAGANILQNSCYTGSSGSNSQNCNAKVLSDTSIEWGASKLYPSEGLTIAVGFKKGIMVPPPPPEFLEQYGLLSVFAILLFGLFAYFFRTWQKYGVDPATPVIYPQFNAPDNMSPGSMGYIQNESFRNNFLTAALVNLAVKGYIKIIESESSGVFGVFKSKVFTIQKLKEPDQSLPVEEIGLMNSLFINAQSSIKFDGNYNYKVENAVNGFRSSLSFQHDKLLNDGNNRKKLLLPFFLISIIYVIGLFVSLSISSDPIFLVAGGVFYVVLLIAFIIFTFIVRKMFWWVFAPLPMFTIIGLGGFAAVNYGNYENNNFIFCYVFLAIAFMSLIIFQYLVKRPSEEKLRKKSLIDGFKMYMGAAENEQLKFHNPPQITPQVFETLLPYAMILGVDDIWGKKFEQIMSRMSTDYNNTWYAGSTLNQYAFASALNSSLTNSIQSTSTQPSSSNSSSSSSGSGGGGFSGGGGGGGGGGGW